MAAIYGCGSSAKHAGSGCQDACCTRRKERGADENGNTWYRC